MILPDFDKIVLIHKSIEWIYSDVSPGYNNKGLIESIAARPHLNIYGHKPYDTIFKAAACMMEGLIRMHPFTDGNKRTALLTARYVLDYNEYNFMEPADMAKFVKSIASSMNNSQDDIDTLIIKIATWLENNSKQQ